MCVCRTPNNNLITKNKPSCNKKKKKKLQKKSKNKKNVEIYEIKK